MSTPGVRPDGFPDLPFLNGINPDKFFAIFSANISDVRHDYLYLSNYDKINNKNVLLTGVTGGIGSSILKKLLLYNFNVISSGRNEDKIKKLYPDLKMYYYVKEANGKYKKKD